MRILIVTQYFWPENFKITDFAVNFQEMGHEVCVLTGIPNYPNGKFYKGYGLFYPKCEYYGHIKIIRTILLPRGKSSNLRLLINYLSFALFASFASIFRISGKFDLIFVFEISPVTVVIPAIVIKKIRKIPIVLWILDLWPESVYALVKINSIMIRKSLDKLVNFIYKHSDLILVSSKGFVNSITKRNFRHDRIRYAPNWAEDIVIQLNNKFINLQYKDLPENGLKIMYAGNLGDAQDFESIISAAEALKGHKNIYWILIGDGRKRAWIERNVSEKGLSENVFLLGSYPIETMPYFFSKADFMLLALKGEDIFSLTVPAKLQTYMANGKPILAMINGETAKIIMEAKAGFVSDAGNVIDFTNNVLKAHSMNEKQRKTLGENARLYYNKFFNKQKIIKDIESNCIELINIWNA